jgi:hypothetical protein
MSAPINDQSTGKAPREGGADSFTQKFWPWLAIGVLVFCWVAEATMCAERGF